MLYSSEMWQGNICKKDYIKYLANDKLWYAWNEIHYQMYFWSYLVKNISPSRSQAVTLFPASVKWQPWPRLIPNGSSSHVASLWRCWQSCAACPLSCVLPLVSPLLARRRQQVLGLHPGHPLACGVRVGSGLTGRLIGGGQLGLSNIEHFQCPSASNFDLRAKVQKTSWKWVKDSKLVKRSSHLI